MRSVVVEQYILPVKFCFYSTLTKQNRHTELVKNTINYRYFFCILQERELTEQTVKNSKENQKNSEQNRLSFLQQKQTNELRNRTLHIGRLIELHVLNFY